MARAPVQPTPPTWISLREAREWATRRYLSPTLAGERVIEWLDDENEPVRWRYEEVKNNSGVSTDTALKKFWHPVGLLVNWEESSAARKVEPARVGSYNLYVYGIRLAREDIELRLAGYDAPASLAGHPAPPPSASVPLTPPARWLAGARVQYPQRKGESHIAWATRLQGLMQKAPVTKVWSTKTVNRRLYDPS